MFSRLDLASYYAFSERVQTKPNQIIMAIIIENYKVISPNANPTKTVTLRAENATFRCSGRRQA